MIFFFINKYFATQYTAQKKVTQPHDLEYVNQY